MSMRQKIERASAATAAIQVEVGKAAQVLDRDFSGRIGNGAGVYSEPSVQKRSLRAAIDALLAALATMVATSWPTRQDYEEAEEE